MGQLVQYLDLLNWQIEYDRAATVTAQELLTAETEACGANYCRCDYCRNWAYSRSETFPLGFRELLHQLGIPLDHECEVNYFGKVKSVLHLYGGWYHFVGRVLSGEKECSANVPFGTFSVSFTSSAALLPKAFLGLPVVQLEFETSIPWLSKITEPL